MRLSSERAIIRWLTLAVAWIVLALFIYVHTRTTSAYLRQVSGMGLRGAKEATTPLQHPVLNFAADAQTWIRYALQLQEGHEIQLRYTHIDNAPDGREVHWNSAWAWIIAGAGELRSRYTHEPLPRATENAAVWLNGFVLMSLVVLFSSWAARQGGAIAGVVVALGMVGSNRFYEGFIPGYVDHHGLLTTSVFGLVLGALFMGGGWHLGAGTAAQSELLPPSRATARRGAIFSAVCGAFGLWISAASVVPPIALVGVTGLIVTFWRGRSALKQERVFDGDLWRAWGTTGAVLSFVFYLLEYAPAHLGMRLEVNHPLYAFAWWGGGELIAQICERWLGQVAGRRPNRSRMIVALFAIAGVPAVVLVGRSRVFLPIDPFMAGLHHSILEFMSLPQRVKVLGWKEAFAAVNMDLIPVVIGVGLLLWWRKRTELLLSFALIAVALFLAMGLWQERWLLNASGPSVCVLLVVIAALIREFRFFRRPYVPIVLAAAIFIPPDYLRIRAFDSFLQTNSISMKDALQPLFRDVAATLRASQPEGDIVLLSSPNSSTGIGYYGRFQTTGTLYWENNTGLQTAAHIFSAHTDDEAAKLIKEHHITHIAMISEENFIGQYYALLHPGASAEDAKKSFGYRLLGSQEFPVWLEVLPYQIPPDLKSLDVRVILFKVNFDQSVADAYYHLAMAQVSWGALEAAERSLDQLILRAPGIPQPWLRKAEVLVQDKRWDESVVAIEKGIALAPAEDRGRLYSAAGLTYYRNGQAGIALAMYQKALTSGFSFDAAAGVAWILATSHDDSLRNGAEALQLAQRLVQANPNSNAALNCLAAAFAETGRMREAVATATKALENAGTDAAVVQAARNHLECYRAGRPWRE